MNKVIDELLVEATILGMMSEAPKSKAAQDAEDLRLVSIGGGNYSDEEGGDTVATTQDGKLVFVDPKKDPRSADGKDSQEPEPTDGQSDDDFAAVGNDSQIEKEKDKEESEEVSEEAKEAIAKINKSLPESITNADPSIARALYYGYRPVPAPPARPIWKPAPGNASSLYNETVSMIGAELLKKSNGKMSDEKLLKELEKTLGDTAAWSDVKEHHIKTTLEAARTKFEMVQQAMEDAGIDPKKAKTKSYYGTNVSLKNQFDDIMKHDGPFVGGNGREIKAIPTDIETKMFLEKFKDPETNKNLTEEDIDGMLNKPNDPETIKRFLALSAYNGGGGGNPSDTATIITDGDKMQFIAFSDKTSLGDQQANSTPNQLLSNFSGTMRILEGEDYEFDPKQKKQMENIIKKQGKNFSAAEKRLAQAQAAPFNILGKLLGQENPTVKKIFDELYDPPDGKRYKPIAAAYKKISQDPGAIDKTLRAAKGADEKEKAMEEAGIDPLPTWGHYLKQAGWEEGAEVTPELMESAYMARAGDSREFEITNEDGELETTTVGAELTGANQQRYISEVIGKMRAEHLDSSSEFELEGDDAVDVLNQKKEIEKYRQESIDALNSMHSELNKFKIEKDGVDAGFGDVLMARDMARALHLGMIDENNAPGLFSFGSVHIVAGQHRTSPEAMRGCLGDVSDVDDLTRNTKTRPVKKSGPELPSGMYESEVSRSTKEEVTNDEGQNLYIVNDEYQWLSEPPKKSKDTKVKGPLGPITGRKVFAYTFDKEGNEIPIGEMSMRTKGGTGLQTTYTFAKSLKDCLESKSGRTNESASYRHIKTLLEMASQV